MRAVKLLVTDIKQQTADTVSIYFSGVSRYRAGQYITLLLVINGKEVRRPYSFSSFPGTDREPFITVKCIENGEATRYLHHHLSVGQTIDALEPNGRFVLPPALPEHLFFFAAGSGISPVYGLIKQALHSGSSRVYLVYSNRSRESTIFYEELQELERKFSARFSITWLFSNGQNLLLARLNRPLLEDFVARNLPSSGRNDALFYTCGPFYYMEMIFITLITLGFRQDQLYKETFTMAEEEDDEDGSLLEAEEAPEYTDAVVMVRNGDQVHRIRVTKEQTILDAALKQGVQLPYSCKRGMCSSCVAQLLTGNVHMHYNQVLTDREVDSGRILTCTSHPLSPELEITI